MHWNKKRSIVTGISLFLVGVFFLSAFLYDKGPSYRYRLLQNPFMQHFVHTYHSMRKLPDLLFFPYFFASSNLTEYRINIPLDNFIRLNFSLPDKPLSGKLEEENKIFVNARFVSNGYGYDDDVDVRFRGLNALHWNSLKKSIRIKFPDDNFYKGIRLLNFVIPYDRDYYIEPLNMYRAKKLDLIDVEMDLARLNINGVDAGVYLVFEHFSPEWFAKKGLPEEKLFGIRDGDVPSVQSLGDYVNMFDKEFDVQKEELVALLELIENATDHEFEKLIPHLYDLEKFYAWNILNILAGSNHQSEVQNTILYFNTTTGKFELIPWDIDILRYEDVPYVDNATRLSQRILSIDSFRERRNEILRTYMNEENLNDDISFYDDLHKRARSDFFRDNTKLYNNFQYLSEVRTHRETILENWERASTYLSLEREYYEIEKEGSGANFADSFESFSQVSLTQSEFLLRNPQFGWAGIDSVSLSGSTVLSGTTIIPVEIKLLIQPGTNIFMGDEASLIAYGDVEITGTASLPVTMRRANSRKAWGTFAVIGENTANLSHFYADGGSGGKIHGIPITGMVAIHGGIVEIDNSQFSNAGDDDALNIKSASGFVVNSSFTDNSSDGLDLDYAVGSFSIENNSFINSGGDAIDMSWSETEIKDNTIRNCGDKGISVGEKSEPLIIVNKIKECDLGIAVKDLSIARIERNELTDNRIGISVYQKKSEYGPAQVTLVENIFIGNGLDVDVEDGSSIFRREEDE